MPGLSWLDIFRLGLVQTALGAIVVLSTSTINRVMVVELALPAMLPGFLVGLHYAVQLSRPRWGYNSDMGGRRTPWIIGGMATLALGGIAAAAATAWMGVSTSKIGGLALAFVAYLLIGGGVGASGTSLLAMLAAKCAPGRRAAAASMVWLMMIAGFVLTATTAGHFLDPFSPARLLAVASVVAGAALLLTVGAVIGIERQPEVTSTREDPRPRPAFASVFREIWAEPKARAFTIFVFVSMLAYSTQDLILEPFAGAVFGMTPGESTKLAGVQHSGVFIGMLLVGFAASGRSGPRLGSLRLWTVGGCIASGLVLLSLALAGFVPNWPLRWSVSALGVANGAFAVAAIGWMMRLAGEGRASREGVRMGLWGAAQAIAFALGGFLGTVGVDLVRYLFEGSPALPYATVFACEAFLFIYAAGLAAYMPSASEAPHSPSTSTTTLVGEYS